MVRLAGNEGNVSIDVAVARREFLLAIWKYTDYAYYLFGTIGNPANNGVNSDKIAAAWVAMLFDAEVPWLRDWARRAVNTMRIAIDQDRDFNVKSMAEIFGAYASPQSLVDSACSEAGDIARELMSSWQSKEWPPDGGFHESKKEFIARMDAAFERRREALAAARTLPTYKPSIRDHAEWTVRRYVLGETVTDIIGSRGTNRTVEKAVKDCAALLNLPPKPPKVARTPSARKRTSAP